VMALVLSLFSTFSIICQAIGSATDMSVGSANQDPQSTRQ